MAQQCLVGRERIAESRAPKFRPTSESYSLTSPIWMIGSEFVYFGMSSIISCACGEKLVLKA